MRSKLGNVPSPLFYKSRHEFRGFVYNKQLTALSQYFDFCFFPELKVWIASF